MIHYKSKEEIELIRNSSLLVSKTLAEVASHLKPGIKTIELDKIAEEFIRDHNAAPGFKGYQGFPASLCISVNEVIVHGIPGNRELVDGDIVSIDCGVLKDGFYGDSAYTFVIGNIEPEIKKLLKTTYRSLFVGIDKAIAGNTIGDISAAIQQLAESAGFSIVRDLVGHGIGKNLHEPPEVPNYGAKSKGLKLHDGLVIAIEPMVNMGVKKIVQEKDKWTIRTADRKPSAHYEHTIAINGEKADVLSTFDYIEESLKENINNLIIIK